MIKISMWLFFFFLRQTRQNAWSCFKQIFLSAATELTNQVTLTCGGLSSSGRGRSWSVYRKIVISTEFNTQVSSSLLLLDNVWDEMFKANNKYLCTMFDQNLILSPQSVRTYTCDFNLFFLHEKETVLFS